LGIDYANMEPREVLLRVIENLAEAQSRMMAVRDEVIDKLGYESIAAHISAALAAAEATLTEAHEKLHES
jgi:hypothetical protein